MLADALTKAANNKKLQDFIQATGLKSEEVRKWITVYKNRRLYITNVNSDFSFLKDLAFRCTFCIILKIGQLRGRDAFYSYIEQLTNFIKFKFSRASIETHYLNNV